MTGPKTSSCGATNPVLGTKTKIARDLSQLFVSFEVISLARFRAHVIIKRMVPETPDIHFDDDRFWSLNDDGTLVIGVGASGLEELGRLQSVKFPRVNQECGEGDILCTLLGDDGELQLVAPTSGVIDAINNAVMQDIEIVNDDPYSEGWLVRLTESS